jgi:tRNA pseudouridine32 synthase / 23S rRNA pseudouridine746 synthase
VSRPRPVWQAPDRNFVPASRVSVTAGSETSVLAFLQTRLPLVGDWPERLVRGEVLDAHGQAVDGQQPCIRGSVLWYWRQVADEASLAVEVGVLKQDERLVFVDKPHGMSVLPGGRHVQETVLIRLRKQLGIPSLSPIHRLDLETAGVMAFSVRPEDRGAYQALFRDRRVEKRYQAVVRWHDCLHDTPMIWRHRLEEPTDERFMQMQVTTGVANAEVQVQLLQRFDRLCEEWHARSPSGWALLELKPTTGRKHQLRAQLNAMDCPIVGDRIYPTLLPPGPPNLSEPLQLLACELAFTDPLTGEKRRVRTARRLSALPAP